MTAPGMQFLPLLFGVSVACAGTAASPAPVGGAQGCYVIQRRTHVTADALELSFPYFFGLAQGDGDEPRVLLPPTELVGRAGHWSWGEREGAVTVVVRTESEGFQLDLRSNGDVWNGRLHVWSAGEVGDWLVAGARVTCPADLVPAGR